MATNFPDEIWQQIFQSLQPATDDTDVPDYSGLVAVCLTCRRFGRIAQPLLYHTVICSAVKAGAFDRLTRALVTNPPLGKDVRAYKADEWHLCTANFSTSTLDMPPDFAEACEEYIWDKWFFTNAAFCLASMPNLVSLDYRFFDTAPMLAWMLSGRLDVDYDHDEQSLGRKHMSSGNGNADEASHEGVMAPSDKTFANFGFPSLKELRLESGGNQTTEITVLEPILLHPGIETLGLRCIGWSGRTARRMQWPEFTSTVQALELDDCFFDAQGIENLLQRFPRLACLTIHHADPEIFLSNNAFGYDGGDDEWTIDLDQIGQSLRRYGGNLVKLCFDTNGHEYSGTDGRLGSLQSLHSLRHLDAVQEELLGESAYENPSPPGSLNLRDVLPRSLETLRLSLYPVPYLSHQSAVDARWGKFRNELYQLLAGGEFPNLRKVVFWDRYILSKELRQIFEGWDSSVAEVHFNERKNSSDPGCGVTLSRAPLI